MNLPLLYDLDPDQLSAWLAERGQPRFRARQVLEWAYQHNASSFEGMTNLPRVLRSLLAESFALGPILPKAIARGQDATKLLLPMPAGGYVECVRIRMRNTYTACLSCQVGCPIGCTFCATGRSGCERSLTAGEILAQLVTLRSPLVGDGPGAQESLTWTPVPPHTDKFPEDKPSSAATAPPGPVSLQVSNVVFMGMGEPFANYANVVRAIRTMTDPRALGMSPSRITVSTVGIPSMIRRYAREGLPTELAVSLNAPDDALRRRLMPGVAGWPLDDVLDACDEYSRATGGQPVTFAYVLIEGVNDLLEHAQELARILRHRRHHLNLIPLNPVPNSSARAPTKRRTNAFLYHCRRFGLNVSLRRSKGADISAACGQLRAHTAQDTHGR